MTDNAPKRITPSQKDHTKNIDSRHECDAVTLVTLIVQEMTVLINKVKGLRLDFFYFINNPVKGHLSTNNGHNGHIVPKWRNKRHHFTNKRHQRITISPISVTISSGAWS